MFMQFFTRVRRVTRMDYLFGGLTKEFWVGHLLVVGSTVLGVYLAAHSGLKTAIEYEAIAADRDNYYMRASLRDEVKYNISISEKIIKKIEKWGTMDRRNYPAFQTYVLDTMKEQSNTLKTPNIILNGTLQYYDAIDKAFQDKQRSLINYPELGKRLRKNIDEYNKKVMSVFDKDLAALKQRLKDNDVVVYN